MKIKIGLFGAGTIGSGVIRIIREKYPDLEIVGVVDKFYKEKKDLLSGIPTSDDFAFLLDNPSVDVFVELMGGVEAPLYVAREALERKKTFITANKALLAKHGYALFEKAREKGVHIGYEAAVAGAIPIIHNLKYIFKNDTILSLQGILNGTSNYILTTMRKEHRDYREVLAEAQKLGLAEADPTLDINGMDAAHKLTILAALVTGQWFSVEQIPVTGIDHIELVDIQWAEKMGYRIRLVGKIERKNTGSAPEVLLSVEPILIGRKHFLWDIEMENNAILLQTEYSQSHMLVGKGAGSLPTAFSVVTDIINYGALDKFPGDNATASMNPVEETFTYGEIGSMESLENEFYLRLEVYDQPGVLAQIASILGNEGISIMTVHQEPEYKDKEKKIVDLVILTHRALRRSMNAALASIRKMEFVAGKSITLPIKET